MHPHLARNMTQNHVFVVELDLKRRVWQRLDDVAVDLYDVVFCHLTPFLLNLLSPLGGSLKLKF